MCGEETFNIHLNFNGIHMGWLVGLGKQEEVAVNCRHEPMWWLRVGGVRE